MYIKIQQYILLLILISKVKSQTIDAFLRFYNEGEQQRLSELPDRKNIFREYDFIVVGAGTAGCTVANRLSEIKDWKILLIEAGDAENLLMDIPVLANYLQFSEANWKYKTEPGERYCLGFKDGRCNWPRGKVMGGSSVINYMIYTRGNRRDYDLWSRLGNTGWSWEEVLPYFKKVENFKIPEYYNTDYHGFNGYLDVGYVPYTTQIGNAWVESSQQAGYKKVDYNGKTQAGTSLLQVSMRGGRRLSSNKAYLYPINNRRNLHVIKKSMVLKLLTNSENEVIGVEFLQNGKKYRVYARKEVILSSGAVNSPKLLMLSGIGPKEDLEKINIPVIKDLRVGHNLMDHIAAGLTFTLNRLNFSLTTDMLMSNINLLNEFMMKGTGPFSIPGGCEALTFLNTRNKNDTDAWPDIEHLFVANSLNANDLIQHNFNFKEDMYNEVYSDLGNSQAFLIFIMLMRPYSRGKIQLRNSNPMAHPLIYPNYYSDSRDLRTMVEGMKEAIRISEQPALKKLGTNLYKEIVPTCSHFEYKSDEYWACHAMHFTYTIYHISGTCKMGPESDPTAVVDPRLKVHGIKGVRVIDVSIIPEVPAAHTNSPVYMIAEKGADMIKEDWGRL